MPSEGAWITGIGLVSTLGQGLDEHWAALNGSKPGADAATFAPFVVHPMRPLNYDAQIPKKGDQRQMEAWQRIGTYAAGLALEGARLKGDAELLGRTDMIVAASGGERDIAADEAILAGLRKSNDASAFLNERLMSDLRPTLFLAQLSNLLAGNISIVHAVTGSSRTFMGEEPAGADALRVSLARIEAGQSVLALVGGAQNAERPDLLLGYEFSGSNLKGSYAPVWEREAQPGFALGSMGVFMVLEAPVHARARGIAPIARLSAVHTERASALDVERIQAALDGTWGLIETELRPGECAIVSGANGAEPATREERLFLSRHSELPVRAPATFFGHGMEAHFPMCVAVAALAIRAGQLYPAIAGDTGVEKSATGPISQAIVTGIGHQRGAAMALVERVEHAR